MFCRRWIQPGLLLALLFSASLFLTGINWGLPSRGADPFLFGDQSVWTGAQTVQLLDPRGSLGIGADVDANPIKHTARPIVINDTDAKRAEIVVRYRLYSSQPDEMITFRALSTLGKTHGDPRLYQYGGLWIYPVGALLKIGSLLHLIELRSDLAFYLDHPEAFGRFYIAARLYVVAWALTGVWAVYWLLTKTTASRWLATLAAMAYAMQPAVINMSHEAKPHLPAVVLTLVALIAAVRYVETGARKSAILTGVFCGAAFGMVLTGVWAFLLIAAMGWLRRRGRDVSTYSPLEKVISDSLLAAGAGLLLFALSNPFVIVHLIGDHSLLASNLGNSRAMYQPSFQLSTLRHAAGLIADGASPVLAVAGALAILSTAGQESIARRLLLVVSIPMLVQFSLLAADKPGEYARFGLMIDIALLISAFSWIGWTIKQELVRRAISTLLCVGVGIWGAGYVWHFAADSVARTSRLIVADRLRQALDRGARELAVDADPAPYCLPPVDLFKWKMLLIDANGAPPATADVFIKPIDIVPRSDAPMIGFRIAYWTRPRLMDTPISWAHKPFRVLLRRDYDSSESARSIE